MPASIHDLPLELFSLILEEASVPTVDHFDQRHSHEHRCPSLLRYAVIFSSVCRDWRHIVMDMPIFWSTIEFAGFLRPSRVEAHTCLVNALQYSNPHLRCICLDFSSLRGVLDAEQIIQGTLHTILQFAPKTWSDLCITVAEGDHLDTISDHFSWTQGAQQKRLASLAALRFNFSQDSMGPFTTSMPQNSLGNYHPRNEALPTYFFDTSLFKSVDDIHLTNVRLLSIGQGAPQIHLDNWTNIIDETVFMKTEGEPTAGLKQVRHHIVTNSAANMINCSLNPSVDSLTIVLPDAGFKHLPLLPSSPFTSNIRSTYCATVWPHIMALRSGGSSLDFIELVDVTPESWLVFLAFLAPISMGPSTPGLLQTAPQTLSWKHIVVRFAPYHRQPQDIPPLGEDLSVRLGGKLQLDFDFRAKFNMVASAEDMGILMTECLRTLTRRMLPMLESFDWYDPRGWHSHLDVTMIEELLAS